MNKSKCIWYFTSILYRLKTSSTSFQSSVALWYYNWLLLGVAKQHYLSLWRHCIGVHANVRALFDWIKESGETLPVFQRRFAKNSEDLVLFSISVPLTVFKCALCYFRFLPPENICPNGRKKATLPKEATNVLRGWLDNNSPRPYPTRETKAALADLTGLTVMQASL